MVTDEWRLQMTTLLVAPAYQCSVTMHTIFVHHQPSRLESATGPPYARHRATMKGQLGTRMPMVGTPGLRQGLRGAEERRRRTTVTGPGSSDSRRP